MLNPKCQHLSLIFSAPPVAEYLGERRIGIGEEDAVKVIQGLNTREYRRTVLAEMPHQTGIPNPDTVGPMRLVHVYGGWNPRDGINMLISKFPGLVIQFNELGSGIIHRPWNGRQYGD